MDLRLKPVPELQAIDGQIIERFSLVNCPIFDAASPLQSDK
jgi:hypothetical protein